MMGWKIENHFWNSFPVRRAKSGFLPPCRQVNHRDARGISDAAALGTASPGSGQSPVWRGRGSAPDPPVYGIFRDGKNEVFETFKVADFFGFPLVSFPDLQVGHPNWWQSDRFPWQKDIWKAGFEAMPWGLVGTAWLGRAKEIQKGLVEVGFWPERRRESHQMAHMKPNNSNFSGWLAANFCDIY